MAALRSDIDRVSAQCEPVSDLAQQTSRRFENTRQRLDLKAALQTASIRSLVSAEIYSGAAIHRRKSPQGWNVSVS